MSMCACVFLVIVSGVGIPIYLHYILNFIQDNRFNILFCICIYILNAYFEYVLNKMFTNLIPLIFV
jgi:hypothetical protein